MSLRRKTDPRPTDRTYPRNMDTSSMIMGAAIASVAWIGFYPWAKLKKLKALEEEEQMTPDAPEGPR